METFLDSLIPYLENFGPAIYGLFFLLAAVESIVFLGVFIPGTLMIIFIGFVSANGSISPLYLIAVTSLGACVGDYISYYLGLKKGRWIISHLSRFTPKRDYIAVGEGFFQRHGNKSVFLGRFVAIIRPFIPFVAGIFKMDKRKFFFWNSLGAVGWSALYILLGYFFGHAWRSVAAHASKIALLLSVVFIFAIVSYFMKKKVVAPVRPHINNIPSRDAEKY